MCVQWVDEFEQQVAAHPSVVDPGLARAGLALLGALPADTGRAVLLVTDLHAQRPGLSPGAVAGACPQSRTWATRHTTRPSTCSTAPSGCTPSRPGWPTGWPACSRSTPVRLRRWLFARCVLEAPGDPALADVASRSTDSRHRGRPRPTGGRGPVACPKRPAWAACPPGDHRRGRWHPENSRKAPPGPDFGARG